MTSTTKEESNAPNSSEGKPNLAVSSALFTKASKDFFGKIVPKGDTLATKDIPTSKNPAPVNRGGSGGIFASFAKAKPTVKREGMDASVDSSTAFCTSTSAVVDSPMKDVSDDDEETYVPLPHDAKKDEEGDRKSRKAREAALAQMMEDDDEEPSLSIVLQDAPETEDLETVPHNILLTASQAPQEYTTVSDGKRRGRRRVMKKITIKDEEGYLGKHNNSLSLVP